MKKKLGILLSLFLVLLLLTVTPVTIKADSTLLSVALNIFNIGSRMAVAAESTNSPTASSGFWFPGNLAFADAGGSDFVTSGSPTSDNQTYYNYGFSFNATATIDSVVVRADVFSAGYNSTASEAIAPTGQVTWTNLDGSYTDIDDDPDSPDGNWADVTDNSSDTLAHVSFPDPSGNLTAGAGNQNFKVWVKRDTSGSTPNMTVSVYEAGSFVSNTSLVSQAVTSTSGELFTGTWNASDLTSINGTDVEAYIFSTSNGSAGGFAWTTPTSETAGVWSNITNGDDDNTGTSASYDHPGGDAWGGYAIYSIASSSINSTRVWVTRESAHIDNMEVDVFYSGGWNNIGSGYPSTDGQFNTYSIGSTQNVTDVRIRFFNTHGSQPRFAYIHEVDFGVVTPATTSAVSVGAVEWNAQYDTSEYDDTVNIAVSWDGGTTWSADNSTTLTSVETSFFPDFTDAFAWTPNSVNNTNFQVRINASTVGNAEQVNLDWIPVTINYTDVSANISNSPGSVNFGTVAPSGTYYSSGSAPTFPLDAAECLFTVTNNSGAAVDITISSTNFTGGVGWVISSSVGEDVVVLKAGKVGDNEGDLITLTGANQTFITGLADSGTEDWELRLETGTYTDGAAKTATVTLWATIP